MQNKQLKHSTLTDWAEEALKTAETLSETYPAIGEKSIMILAVSLAIGNAYSKGYIQAMNDLDQVSIERPEINEKA